MSNTTSFKITAQHKLVFVSTHRYCKVPVKEALLSDLLPGPVTLVFERSEVLNTDLNPFTSVSPFLTELYWNENTHLLFTRPVCCSACRRTYPRPCLHETPLPDVRRTTRTYQRQHQLAHQHRGCTCKWKVMHNESRDAFVRVSHSLFIFSPFPSILIQDGSGVFLFVLSLSHSRLQNCSFNI